MSESDESVLRCDFCRAPFTGGRKWVLLNRYGVGTGERSALVSIEQDGQYRWEVPDDGDWCISCAALCYPTCLLTWIEGKMVEVDATPC